MSGSFFSNSVISRCVNIFLQTCIGPIYSIPELLPKGRTRGLEERYPLVKPPVGLDGLSVVQVARRTTLDQKGFLLNFFLKKIAASNYGAACPRLRKIIVLAVNKKIIVWLSASYSKWRPFGEKRFVCI